MCVSIGFDALAHHSVLPFANIFPSSAACIRLPPRRALGRAYYFFSICPKPLGTWGMSLIFGPLAFGRMNWKICLACCGLGMWLTGCHVLRPVPLDRDDSPGMDTAMVVVPNAMPTVPEVVPEAPVPVLRTGAGQPAAYLPLLAGKRVALAVNHTALTPDGQHLADALLAQGQQVVRIFAPEHGFRGMADAGQHIQNGRDADTGLPIASLYGKDKKPSAAQMADIDVIVFDMQDVGARFYTYISTLGYLMEACARYQKPLIVLDRPNPNGRYVDGPVLDTAFRSFVGMYPIPVLHGLTIGELAQMINGEGWLPDGLRCKLSVVPCAGYDRNMPWSLPVRPSPNLPNDQAIALYASLCLFEGTSVSVGRGTDFPFQVVGGPEYAAHFGFSFVPVSRPGATKPLQEGRTCHGLDLRQDTTVRGFSLAPLLAFYEKSPDKAKFFNAFFDKLAGTDQLRLQISRGMNEVQIRATWQPALEAFRRRRQAYLMYGK